MRKMGIGGARVKFLNGMKLVTNQNLEFLKEYDVFGADCREM